MPVSYNIVQKRNYPPPCIFPILKYFVFILVVLYLTLQRYDIFLRKTNYMIDFSGKYFCT